MNTHVQLPSISRLFEDPFNLPGSRLFSNEPAEHKCETSLRDARINSKGDRIYLHAGTKRVLNADNDPDTNSSALLKTRYYDVDNWLEYTETTIQSKHLIVALKKVIGTTTSQIDFTAEKLVIREFERCLFHYYKQLQEYGKTLTDETAIRHVDFALQSLYKDLGQEMQFFRNMVESAGSEPRLDFATLWMAFSPGDLVVHKVRNINTVHRVVKTWYRQDKYGVDNEMYFLLRSLDFDGEFFGYVTESYRIQQRHCEGFTRLDSLHIIPLKYLESSRRGEILEHARARGEQFLELSTKVSHWDYHGSAMIVSPYHSDIPKQEKIMGRVVIDCKRWYTNNPEFDPGIDITKRRYTISQKDEIDETEVVLAQPEVGGFSFGRKSWCNFDVDKLHQISYNHHAFEELIIPSEKKDMIKALVATHQHNDIIFDDIIKGKGKGIIMLLHGTPGVGKTLTAESIAEHVERPLYSITAGDLSGHDMERKLTGVLDLVSHWNAILLIDEADVFLEERNTTGLERNSIVSVFLRTLEYFEGLLILTTNRVGTIDPAFRSRIHLGVKYTPLSPKVRQSIWEMFIRKASYTNDDEVCEWITDNLLEELSRHEFNGRMIKNAVRMAFALAVSERTQMDPRHLQRAVEAINVFEDDMTDALDEDRRKGKFLGEQVSSSSSKRRRVS